MNFKLYNGDCLNELKNIPDNSVDSCITDPPYGLAFMNKKWDYDVPSIDIWKEVYRVLKPGGYLLAFFGSRTYHRGAVRIEDAGFEIRDQLFWLYKTGFPKGINVSKSIDKKLGAEREKVKIDSSQVRRPVVVGGGKCSEIEEIPPYVKNAHENGFHEMDSDIPVTEEAKEWYGWNTALKPAHEPIVMARKPIVESTVAENVLKYGTGAINIESCRVGEGETRKTSTGGMGSSTNKIIKFNNSNTEQETFDTTLGRWPSNVLHDGSDEVIKSFIHSGLPDGHRFFYSAKASKEDRDEGLDEFQSHKNICVTPESGRNTEYKNIHPTVKPTDLMQYFIKLVTKKGGTVLDPFMGSGSTGKACGLEDYNFIGVERDPDYFKVAKARIEYSYNNKPSTLTDFFE